MRPFIHIANFALIGPSPTLAHLGIPTFCYYWSLNQYGSMGWVSEIWYLQQVNVIQKLCRYHSIRCDPMFHNPNQYLHDPDQCSTNREITCTCFIWKFKLARTHLWWNESLWLDSPLLYLVTTHADLLSFLYSVSQYLRLGFESIVVQHVYNKF